MVSSTSYLVYKEPLKGEKLDRPKSHSLLMRYTPTKLQHYGTTVLVNGIEYHVPGI